MMESTFRLRLQQTRKKRELNQDELARKAGLASTAISHYESGARKPSFDNLRKLADALEVSIDYLMGRTDSSIVRSSFGMISGEHGVPDSRFRNYDNLTDSDRELVRDFISMLLERH